jgi:mannose-6-phosphate isomerase
MGIHPMVPSRVIGSDRLLAEEIDAVLSTSFRGGLPFLFKVLSIGKALSIQVHPPPEAAKSLYRDNRLVYPGT